MTKKRWLYVALGVVAVISIGAIGLGDQSIVFPDGTVQTTAFTAAGDPIQGSAEFYVSTLDFCSGLHDLFVVPTGKLLEITWISILFYSTEAIIDPVRFNLRTWSGPGQSIDHPIAFLDNQTLLNGEIFPSGSWHSMVDLVSAPGETVKVSACKNSDAGNMTVRVTFTGRLYEDTP